MSDLKQALQISMKHTRSSKSLTLRLNNTASGVINNKIRGQEITVRMRDDPKNRKAGFNLKIGKIWNFKNKRVNLPEEENYVPGLH
ncbi:hypothetical protein SERLA73DRAFT_68200 [Serpula lacrymans var. lacrymans S7.3]|uniref:Uncharacterized protein n=1 Tax=Serpula lacrymans var. lacrymans (strain S7.3) TaxID=936435 RepID=F8PHI5_SERL3|nr:hypothetical protein SERLA73DRAFT_68200 [Serpula lacrymans var. lacrymans S7.3]